jgi:hypothetical protein
MGKLQLRSSILLNKIAQVEDNLEYLATVETIDNGKRYVKQWPLIPWQ